MLIALPTLQTAPGRRSIQIVTTSCSPWSSRPRTVRSAKRVIDYDWVKISEREYLLPTRADVQLAARYQRDKFYSRNLINFRGYRKFGAEVKIIIRFVQL